MAPSYRQLALQRGSGASGVNDVEDMVVEIQQHLEAGNAMVAVVSVATVIREDTDPRTSFASRWDTRCRTADIATRLTSPRSEIISYYGVGTNWNLESRATSQTTSDIENLTVRDKYTRHDEVHTVSGLDMDISHTSSIVVYTQHLKLHMKNILHVLHGKRSLLSAKNLPLIIVPFLWNFTPVFS